MLTFAVDASALGAMAPKRMTPTPAHAARRCPNERRRCERDCMIDLPRISDRIERAIPIDRREPRFCTRRYEAACVLLRSSAAKFWRRILLLRESAGGYELKIDRTEYRD
jgi:hypothetical protein